MGYKKLSIGDMVQITENLSKVSDHSMIGRVSKVVAIESIPKVATLYKLEDYPDKLFSRSVLKRL